MKWILIILSILLMGFVIAADFTPQGQINLRDIYGIRNITNITFSNGYLLNGTTINNQLSNIGWSNLTNYPSACPSGSAITQLDDSVTCTSWNTYQNITYNNSGFFYNSNKAFTKTADVTVCRGQNTLDDVVKQFQCDVVCASTDSDCGDDVNSVDGNVILMNGFYNFQTDINLKENMSLIGVGKVVINFSNTFNINSVSGSNSYNNKLANLEFSGSLPHSDRGYSTGNPLINLTKYNNLQNFEMENIRISNLNGTAIQLEAKTGGNLTNIKLKNIFMSEVRDGIRLTEQSEAEGRIKNVKIENFELTNYQYYSAFYSIVYIGYGVFGIGIEGFEISNVYTRKAADGPTVLVLKSQNGIINNIKSVDQHDYAVSIHDNSKNIDISNVYSINPQNYGPLYMQTINYNTPQVMENIKARNLYCTNCSKSILANYPIWIEVDDSDNSGGNKIKNVEISNFVINDTATNAAIQIEATKGDIDGLIIRDGVISNTNNSAIRFTGRNLTNNVLIENVQFIRNGLSPASGNNDLNTSIFFSYANVTNVNLINNDFSKSLANNTLLLYAHSSNGPGSYLDLYGYNNKGTLRIKTDLNAGSYYIDNYQYPSSLQTCSTSSASVNRIAQNVTGFYGCNGTAWRAL